MGLFDELAGSVLKSVTSNEGMQNNLLGSVTEMLGSSGTGGIAGLAKTFADKGLGDVVNSWIGTGKNLPISADQIQQVLGNPQIAQVAQKLGVSPADASKALAQFLPQIIDKLTPNGSVPTDDVVSKGLGALKGSIFGQ